MLDKIFCVDDDPITLMLCKKVIERVEFAKEIITAQNGEEAIQYFHDLAQNQKQEASASYPKLIFLDLNMPKKDGREALKEIKNNSDLRGIPVVVLTTSKAEEDIYRTYHLGVNSFITKPVTFDSLVNIIKELGRYWFEIVELPLERKSL